MLIQRVVMRNGIQDVVMHTWFELIEVALDEFDNAGEISVFSDGRHRFMAIARAV